MRPKIRVPLTIRIDPELREGTQLETERNRRTIRAEIMVLVDAKLAAGGASNGWFPTLDPDPQGANRSVQRATSRKDAMGEMHARLDEFVGISDQKFPPADQFTPTPEVIELLADLAAMIRKAWALLT